MTDGRRVNDINKDFVVQENARSMGVLTQVNIPGKYLVDRLCISHKLPFRGDKNSPFMILTGTVPVRILPNCIQAVTQLGTSTAH